MKLSLKQKAFVQTLGLIGVACIVGTIVGTVLSMIPPEAAPYILMAVSFGFCFYLMYGINVSRLEHQESLKRLKESNETD